MARIRVDDRTLDFTTTVQDGKTTSASGKEDRKWPPRKEKNGGGYSLIALPPAGT
jgi:hypothetical protein